MRHTPRLALSAVALLATTALISAPASASAPARGPAAPPGPAGGPAAAAPADWPTYHGSNYRAGNATTMPPVSGAMTITKQLTLDGRVYASPIIVKGVAIVATENDTVYAFDTTTWAQLWKTHLGTPVPKASLPCGDIDPLGITGTPAYDSVHNSVYVAAELNTPIRHQLVSLNFATGAIRWNKNIDLPGVTASAMQQRGALAAVGVRVWVPFGGLAGDCADYKGRVVGLHRSDGLGPLAYTVPTAREAGIWTPPGPTADSAGHIFVAVGNGASGVGDPYDHSDSVLRLNTAAQLVDYFSPTTWATDNDADLDLGSQGPAIVGPWIFSAGKSGTAYVLRRSALGHIGGQVSKATVCPSFGGTAANGDVVYVPCSDGVRAVRIDSAGTMHILWHATAAAGAPVIGGGRVWSINQSGTLFALNPATGATTSSIAVGTTSRFATPAVYGSQLFIPTLTGLTVVGTS